MGTFLKMYSTLIDSYWAHAEILPAQSKIGASKNRTTVFGNCSCPKIRRREKRIRVMCGGVVPVRKEENWSMAHDSEIEPASPAHFYQSSIVDQRPLWLKMMKSLARSRMTYQMPSSPPFPLPPMLQPLPTIPSVFPSLSTPISTTVGRPQHQLVSPWKAQLWAPNFNSSNLKVLLDTVRDVLPTRANEQTIVTKQFNDESGAVGMYRVQNALKRKFFKLANMEMRTV